MQLVDFLVIHFYLTFCYLCAEINTFSLEPCIIACCGYLLESFGLGAFTVFKSNVSQLQTDLT